MSPVKCAASDYETNLSFSCGIEQVHTLMSRREVLRTLHSDWDFLEFLHFFETSAGAFN